MTHTPAVELLRTMRAEYMARRMAPEANAIAEAITALTHPAGGSERLLAALREVFAALLFEWDNDQESRVGKMLVALNDPSLKFRPDITEVHAAIAALASPQGAPIDRLLARWEKIAATHGVRSFTGNDHLLFANELRVAYADHAAALAASEARCRELDEFRAANLQRAQELTYKLEVAEQSLAEALKDAGRYRRLRDEQATIIYKRTADGTWEPLVDTCGASARCSSLDAAIDALPPKGEGETS